MKIEFGGGTNPRKLHYVQADIRNLGNNIVCNTWNIVDHVQPNTVTDIYSRHLFEHLTHKQAIRTLKAWKTICAEEARVELICPNMLFHLEQWKNWGTLNTKEKDYCRAGFWGWQREADESAWDLHKSGYDFDKLKELVETHRFKKFKALSEPNIKNPHLEVEFYA